MTKRIQSININLLYHLQLLLEEAHVSRAAHRAGVSQPAMSASLKQLRRLFSDPLLVHSFGGGLELTPLGQDLVVDLEQLLSLTGADRIRLATADELSRLYPDCEPGAMPPMSAWCAREASQNAGRASPGRCTGLTTVRSGITLPTAKRLI